MKKHPYFDLLRLEDDEIENILNVPISKRETLHDWPLSCVEQITTVDHQQWILKTNHEPCNLEGYFYQQVQHRNILKPVCVQDHPPYQSIIYPFIEGIPYSLVNLNKKRDTIIAEKELHERLDEIAQIARPGLPAYLKIDTADSFHQAFQPMLERIIHLKEDGKFNQVLNPHLKALTIILDEKVTEEVALMDTGYVHGDFTVDNIIYSGELKELIFLDWQRPLYGSKLIDEYTFVKSREFKPDPPAMLIGALFEIYWFTDCATTWFPAGIPTYDFTIKRLIEDLAEAYQALLNTNHTNM